MIAALAQQFERLERSRNDLQQRLAHFETPQSHFRPSPEAWSIAEVVHHLVLAEQFAALYIEKKLNDRTKVRTLAWEANVRSALLCLAMRSPFRFKAPTPLVLPSGNLPLPELLAQWHELRGRWATLLERVTPDLLRLSLYRHPVAGLLTISQAITFQQEHFNHHLRQIQRILAAPNFPAARATSKRNAHAAH